MISMVARFGGDYLDHDAILGAATGHAPAAKNAELGSSLVASSTFAVVFPAIAMNNLAFMEDTSSAPDRVSDPEPRVLLADDSAVEREALATLLRQAGYHVDEADDGEAAILFLKGQAPDLLLLDLQMPGTDGF